MKLSLPTLALALALAASGAAHAGDDVFSQGFRFQQRDGAALYGAICAGCHMPRGQGAQGAGTYPALAGNPKLVAAGYVGNLVVNGRRAMPAFGGQLDDEQIAAVVTYVRRELGHIEGDPMRAADIAALRR